MTPSFAPSNRAIRAGTSAWRSAGWRDWGDLIKRCASGDDGARIFRGLNAVQEREAFRCDFGIGQNVFNRGELRFGQKQRIGQPIQDTLVKRLLGTDGWAVDPNCSVDLLARWQQRGTPAPTRSRARMRPDARQLRTRAVFARSVLLLRPRPATTRSKNLPLEMVRRIAANFKPQADLADRSRSHPSPDRLGNSSESRHQIREYVRDDRLFSIALS